ncbi:hypothetical protein MPNTM1_00040 [Mycolicibacterium parafortuitum]|uniref:hypothetical protein n=1 Tax=Mycolicibacterium parafortuitum TaxID=39692 RepID=UPI0032C48C47
MTLLLPTQIALIAATLTFLLALMLGLWKFYGMATSPSGHAHPYIDIAHRAALLYAFAIAMLAPLVQFTTWSAAQNVVAVAVVVFFFEANIVNYIRLGWSKSTTNQLHPLRRSAVVAVAAIALGEGGGVAFILLGFVLDQFAS